MPRSFFGDPRWQGLGVFVTAILAFLTLYVTNDHPIWLYMSALSTCVLVILVLLQSSIGRRLSVSRIIGWVIAICLGLVLGVIADRQLRPVNTAGPNTLFSDFTDFPKQWEARLCAGNTPCRAADPPIPSPNRTQIGFRIPLIPGQESRLSIRHMIPVKAGVVVARLFVTDIVDVESAWVAVVADSQPDVEQASVVDSTETFRKGEWRDLVLDLREQYDASDQRLSKQLVRIRIEYRVTGRSGLGPEAGVEVRLADVRWIETEGYSTPREQRGPGRLLHDFESQDVTIWGTEALQPQGNTPVARGLWSAKWEVQVSGAISTGTLTIPAQDILDPGLVSGVIHVPAGQVPPGTILYVSLLAGGQEIPGSRRQLLPGEWVRFWGDTPSLERQEIQIQLSTNEGGYYQGPVYLDDIELLESAESVE